MARLGLCYHKACPPGQCQQLTPAELTPDPADIEYAKQLIAEGYHSVSNAFRHVSKYKNPRPTGAEMIRPEFLNTREGQAFVKLWDSRHTWGLRCDPENTIVLTLTVKQYRAFKKLGGPTG
jgi:hypothetical protein